jgi:uncharacterized protein YndB with AHSA1/START domain
MALSEPQPKTALEQSVNIARPIDDVWNLMIDWSLAPGWWPRVLDVEGPLPVGPGDMLTFSYQGTPASAIVDVADEPNRLVIRRVSGSVEATFDYRLESDTDSTNVGLKAELVARHALRAVAPLLRRALAHTDRDQMNLLKQLAEGAAEPSS